MRRKTDPKPSQTEGNKGSFEGMDNYTKGLELAQAGRYQEALSFMLQHLSTTAGNAQELNDTGAILHCLGRSEEAIEYFIRALDMKKDSAEIVWNLAETYLAIGMASRAAELFDKMENLSVLNVDILNRAANIFLNQGNKAGAIETLLRSLRVYPEQEILKPMVQIIRSKRLKIAFFCGGDGMNFLHDIYEFISERFEARLFEGQSEKELFDLMQWSDVSWFEWCTNLAAIGSKQPKVCHSIIRLHRYEAYELWPQQIEWNNIDLLITVGNNFVMDALVEQVPDIHNQTSIVNISNGVNIDKFAFINRQPGKNIAFVSNLRLIKNPAFVLQCMQKLHYIDPQYRLFFAGSFQDQALEQYIRHMVDALDLQDVVFFDGRQEDVNSWLMDKHYIVSTSIIESQGMGLLEAMACGLKPVIHNFPGAAEIFPSEYLFNISEEFCEQIYSSDYEPQKYRRFVEDKYPLKKQLLKINNLFNEIESKIEIKESSEEKYQCSGELYVPAS